MENIEALYERTINLVTRYSKDIEKAGEAIAVGLAVYYTASVSLQLNRSTLKGVDMHTVAEKLMLFFVFLYRNSTMHILVL